MNFKRISMLQNNITHQKNRRLQCIEPQLGSGQIKDGILFFWK